MEDLNYADTTFTPVQPTNRKYNQKLDSYALYAGFGWDFLDDFTLEGGVRWNYDRKDFSSSVQQDDGGLAGPPRLRPAKTPEGLLMGTAPTGTLTLSYRFSEEVSSYWKYSRGWKPGTFNSIAVN